MAGPLGMVPSITERKKKKQKSIERKGGEEESRKEEGGKEPREKKTNEERLKVSREMQTDCAHAGLVWTQGDS